MDVREAFDDTAHVEVGEQNDGATEVALADGRCRVKVSLPEQVARRLAERVAARYDLYLLASPDTYEDLAIALQGEESKWGRAERLLERAAEELVGRGASTVVERAAAAAIGSALTLIAEDLHPMHHQQVRLRQQEDGLFLQCPECESTKVHVTVDDADGGAEVGCLECGATFSRGQALLTGRRRHGCR